MARRPNKSKSKPSQSPADPSSKFASWGLNNWREDVWPNTPERARRILRIYRKELMSCGALARIGRELIVFGSPYLRWVHSNSDRVNGYRIAANQARVEQGSLKPTA